jgi:hypothetical protein
MSKFGPKGKTGAHGFQRYRPSPAELRKAVLAIPKDTRDITGLVAGDPLPERSALAKKQAEGK